MEMCQHADVLTLLRYYLIKRFYVDFNEQTLRYLETIVENSDECYIVYNPSTDNGSLRGLAFRTNTEITLFSCISCATVAYRFMKYIIREAQSPVLTCNTNNGNLGKMLIKLGWQLVDVDKKDHSGFYIYEKVL